MGEHNVERIRREKAQAFMKALLEDLRALDYMIEDGLVESGVTRIGAEQEMFLIDRYLRPAPVSLEVLEHGKRPATDNRDRAIQSGSQSDSLRLTDDCFIGWNKS